MDRQPSIGRRIGFGERPAVVVIDLTLAFTTPGRPLACDCSAVIAATNRVIAAARTRALPVLFTVVRYDAPDLADAGLWGRKIAVGELRADGDGADLDPRLARRATDAVVVKKFASCFFGTELAGRLGGAGVDTVVLCGVTTSGCVRASAVDALQSGLRPIVVAEAVGDRWSEAHERSLADMDAKYADVMPLDAVVAQLAVVQRRVADAP